MGDEPWDQDNVWRDKKGRPLECGGGGAECASEHPDAKEHCSLCLDPGRMMLCPCVSCRSNVGLQGLELEDITFVSLWKQDGEGGGRSEDRKEGGRTEGKTERREGEQAME